MAGIPGNGDIFCQYGDITPLPCYPSFSPHMIRSCPFFSWYWAASPFAMSTPKPVLPTGQSKGRRNCPAPPAHRPSSIRAMHRRHSWEACPSRPYCPATTPPWPTCLWLSPASFFCPFSSGNPEMFRNRRPRPERQDLSDYPFNIPPANKRHMALQYAPAPFSGLPEND